MNWLRHLLGLDRPQHSTPQRVNDLVKRTDEAVAKANQTIADLEERRRYLEAVHRSYEGRGR